MSPQPAPIFISYARSDGRAFAQSLRHELVRLGFTVWQDVIDMEVGEHWWPQIIEAIEKSVTMLLVLTPAALESHVVRDEWTYARTVGTHVLPVVDHADLLARAKAWTRKVDVAILDPQHPDRESTWERVLKQLHDRPARRPRPFTAPNLPSHFVERPIEFQQLVERILDQDRAGPTDRTAALLGGAGFGKTTLAVAVCHDPRVRVAFDGGILWIQFKPNSSGVDALALLNDQVKRLDPEGPTFNEITQASARFRELLADRDLLVVLDDVWSESHLPFFIHKGTTYLITTRLQAVVAHTEADGVLVDELRINEAIGLLSKFLPHPPGELDEAALRDLAHRLGGWTLLLELVGAELRALQRNGRELRSAVEYVIERLNRRGFTYLDRHQEGSRNAAIAESLNASLKTLAPTSGERFYELGIFRADTDVPFGSIEQLWGATAGMDILDAEDALEAMQRLSLFARYDSRGQVLRFHPVVRHVVATKLTDQRRIHNLLVEHWGQLHHLPDGFAWRNLIYHLQNAGRLDDALHLLFDLEWIRTKLAETDTVSLLSDYLSVPDQDECRLMAGVLKMAGDTLADPAQVASQLVGRLTRFASDRPLITTLLGQVQKQVSEPALLPVRVNLPSVDQGVHTCVRVGEAILSGALSDDHAHLILGLADGRLQVWDWRLQKLVQTLETGVGPVFSLAVHGDLVAVGGYFDHWTPYDRPAAPVEIWNWTSGQKVGSLGTDLPDAQNGYSIAFRDSRVGITTGEQNNYIHLYDWVAMKPIAMVDGVPDDSGGANSPGALAFAGPFMLYQSSSGWWRTDVWVADELRHLGGVPGRLGYDAPVIVSADRLILRKQFEHRPEDFDGFFFPVTHSDSPPDLNVWNYDEPLTATAEIGGELFVCREAVEIRDSTSGQLRARLEGHSGRIISVNVLADALITASHDGSFRIWDRDVMKTSTKGRAKLLPKFYLSSITHLALNGDSLFVGTQEGELQEWSWRNASLTSAVRMGSPIRALAVTDRWIAVSCFDRAKDAYFAIRARSRWSLAPEIAEWRETADYRISNGIVDFGERGVVMASVCDDTVAVVVKDYYTPQNSISVGPYTGNSIYVIDHHTGECALQVGEWISAVALAKDVVVGGRQDGLIDVWERGTGRLLQHLSGHSHSVTGLELYGHLLASCSLDGTVRLWSMLTGEMIQTFRHGDSVNGIDVHGDLLLTASDDHTLRVLNWRRAEEIARFTDDAQFSACVVSPDLSTIAGGGKSGHLQVLGLSGQLRALVGLL